LRIIALILSVMGVLYGALLAIKPQLAVGRSETVKPAKLIVTRIKGIIALGIGAFMLWRTQN
jgi:hypothetical protein